MGHDLERLLERAGGKARPAVLAAAGLLVLVGLYAANFSLARRASLARARLSAYRAQAEETEAALSDAAQLREERDRAVSQFKAGLPKLAASRRQIYEGGLQLQEEKRLLEKQLEIMTTYLLVDETAGKVSLMRGEQALETYPLGAGAPRAYGAAGAPAALTRIVSKERYAHPERPKSEQVGKQLTWEPPQVGESARAKALGQYVIFTSGPLILHGPPKSAADHAAYPHVCLELPLAVAKRLYEETYIGTKVLLRGSPPAPPGSPTVLATTLTPRRVPASQAPFSRRPAKKPARR